LLHFLVRLACVRHAASVDSEPGSNSRLKPVHSPDGSSANLTDLLTLNPFRSKPQTPVDIPTIIGELPSRLIRHRLAYAKPHARNSPDGPDSCEITRAITLVHLTTGTFNHFVKDPIALRLSGAFQVPQAISLKLLETCCPRPVWPIGTETFCFVALALSPVLHLGFSSKPAKPLRLL
jgi:hypothetical protein